MKIYRVKEKSTNKCEYFRFQKDVAGYIGRKPRSIRKQFSEKGYFENKDYIINQIELK